MKFSEAREKAEKGDILKLSVPGPGLGYFITEIKVGFNHYFNITWEQYDSCDWQIIPAEPVVLSAEEIIRKTRQYKQLTMFSLEEVLEIIYCSRDNFRLERGKELQPVIDLIDSRRNDYHGGAEIEIGMLFDRLNQIIKNLPPLNKNEE